MTKDLIPGGFKLRRGRLTLAMGEVEVPDSVDGYQVKMGVRHFQTHYGKTAAIAVESLFDGAGNRFGEQQHMRQPLVGKVEKLIHFQFWHHQGLSLPKGIDIQEGKKLVILRDPIGRDFSGNDL